jgi:DNA-directed RNA polymerase beta subunit
MMTETKKVSMGLLPAMVKLNLCWLHKLQESDCQFDFGGYFLIKGTEKVLPDMIHAAHLILTNVFHKDHCIMHSYRF